MKHKIFSILSIISLIGIILITLWKLCTGHLEYDIQLLLIYLVALSSIDLCYTLSNL